MEALVERLTPAQVELLEAYHQLLRERGVPLGVVSAGDRDRLWDRHIIDSLRGAVCIPPRPGERVADLGSGGGLPGIPIAIARPDLRVHLVESRARRAAFLELAVEHLGMGNVEVRASRVEDCGIQVDACLARALAAPERVWGLGSLLLAPGGFVLYWAGRSWGRAQQGSLASLGARAEVCAEPSEDWQGSVVKISRTVPTPDHSNP
jgi:16S rRNA (guanine527-N7)-methyltransferase